MVWIRARLTARYLPSTRIDGVVLFRLALLVILQSDQLPSPERWVSVAFGERSCLTPRSITIERHVRRGSDRQRSSLASSAHLSCKSSGLLHRFDVGDFLEGHRKKAFLPPPGTPNPTGIMATSRPPVTRLQRPSSSDSYLLPSALLAKKHFRPVWCPANPATACTKCTYHRITPAPAGETGAWLCVVKAKHDTKERKASTQSRCRLSQRQEIASTATLRQFSRVNADILGARKTAGEHLVQRTH